MCIFTQFVNILPVSSCYRNLTFVAFFYQYRFRHQAGPGVGDRDALAGGQFDFRRRHRNGFKKTQKQLIKNRWHFSSVLIFKKHGNIQ